MVTGAVALSYFETDIPRFLHFISVISILIVSYSPHISFLQAFWPPFCMHFQSLPHVCTDLVVLNKRTVITILLPLRLLLLLLLLLLLIIIIIIIKVSSPVKGQERPRVFQEVKVPRFHDNGTEWWEGCHP